MDDIPTPQQLRVAGRACNLMAYAAGLAGVAAGTLVLRQGQLGSAVILWTMTFAVGAALMGVSIMIRAMVGLTARTTRMEADLRLMLDARSRGPADGTWGVEDRDPWLRH
jgi:hypothetical protein